VLAWYGWSGKPKNSVQGGLRPPCTLFFGNTP
jgi:hypothetical protein